VPERRETREVLQGLPRRAAGHELLEAVAAVGDVGTADRGGRELAAVYVPTTPNPTSGYLEIVPVERITPTDWTVDQAMSFIISGGAVAPESIPWDPPAKPDGHAPVA